jgi:hypothetical protein
MRKTTAILDAAEEQSGSVHQQGGARIENAIDGVRPVFTAQDWIRRMPLKKCLIVVHDPFREDVLPKDKMALESDGSGRGFEGRFLGLVMCAV